MSGPIGYYVHHQGDGHRQRAVAIARETQGRIVLLGTGLEGRCQDLDVVELPDDRPNPGSIQGYGPCGTADGLHYAPLGHDGVRRRVARIAGWIAETRPVLMVIDVSVEVAMLARLASTPFVYVRLNGRRSDPPHRQAFDAAAGLLSPLHAALDDEDTPNDIRRKTFYAPGLVAAPPATAAARDRVLGVIGQGGGAGHGERWAAAARATPHVHWQVIGRCTPPRDTPANLEWLGWVDDAPARIAGAGIVVGAAGDGLVSSVIAAGRPFICIPEARPFDEQNRKAARLATLGAAVVRPAWPSAGEWPDLLTQASALDTQVLSDLGAADGARRAADWVLGMAASGANATL